MSPAQLERLQAIADFVSAELHKSVPSARIIDDMVAKLGAKYRTDSDPNRLTAGGVTGTCTWSRDIGLLESWRRNATVRIARERMAA